MASFASVRCHKWHTQAACTKMHKLHKLHDLTSCRMMHLKCMPQLFLRVLKQNPTYCHNKSTLSPRKIEKNKLWKMSAENHQLIQKGEISPERKTSWRKVFSTTETSWDMGIMEIIRIKIHYLCFCSMKRKMSIIRDWWGWGCDKVASRSPQAPVVQTLQIEQYNYKRCSFKL